MLTKELSRCLTPPNAALNRPDEDSDKDQPILDSIAARVHPLSSLARAVLKKRGSVSGG